MCILFISTEEEEEAALPHRFLSGFGIFYFFFSSSGPKWILPRNLLPRKCSFSRRFHRETGLQPVCDPRGGACLINISVKMKGAGPGGVGGGQGNLITGLIFEQKCQG